jgi:hypothetical protein
VALLRPRPGRIVGFAVRLSTSRTTLPSQTTRRGVDSAAVRDCGGKSLKVVYALSSVYGDPRVTWFWCVVVCKRHPFKNSR